MLVQLSLVQRRAYPLHWLSQGWPRRPARAVNAAAHDRDHGGWRRDKARHGLQAAINRRGAKKIWYHFHYHSYEWKLHWIVPLSSVKMA
jgi:hypothetical protein